MKESKESSLAIARAKLGNLLEIYAPMGTARANIINALTASLVEFEQAVREDAAGTDATALQSEVERLRNELQAAEGNVARLTAQLVAASAPKFDAEPAKSGDEMLGDDKAAMKLDPPAEGSTAERPVIDVSTPSASEPKAEKKKGNKSK